MKRIVLPLIAAVLALAAFGSFATLARSSGSPTNYKAETTPTPTPAPAQVETVDPAEPAEPAAPAGVAEPASATEVVEPAGAADVGHADATNDPNADHQFDGEE